MVCGLMSEGKPFTANGFTSGRNGRLGVPELRTTAPHRLREAVIFRLHADGAEEVVGVFDAIARNFITN